MTVFYINENVINGIPYNIININVLYCKLIIIFYCDDNIIYSCKIIFWKPHLKYFLIGQQFKSITLSN